LAALRTIFRILLPLVLLSVAPAAAAFKYVEVGQEAPDFKLEAAGDDDPIQLKEHVGPKALAVVFWAAWSPRSQAMLNDLESLYRDRKEQGFAIIAVNVEHEEIDADERRKIEEMASNWSFPVALDDALGTYYLYGVVATPTLALVDEQGVVRYVRASYSTSARAEIREAVDGLLGLAGAETPRVAVKKRDYVPPKKATLHYQKASILLRRGMEKRAIRDLEKAAKIDPGWAEPRVLLARIYRSEARKKPSMLAKAEAVLRETRELQPHHLQTLASLAEVLVATGNSEEALQVADEAIALDPAYTPALLAKATSLRALARVDEAQSVVNEALELDPHNPGIWVEKGELAATRGHWEEAASALRKAVDLALITRSREG
jgi:tetratricopeptide (TPR) repeat protein